MVGLVSPNWQTAGTSVFMPTGLAVWNSVIHTLMESIRVMATRIIRMMLRAALRLPLKVFILR